MKKMFLVVAVLLTIASSAQAGWIADGVVKKVANISSNEDEFSVIVEGTGICNDQYISFSLNNFPLDDTGNFSKDAYDRAYKNSLASLMSGFKVRIYNYIDDSCLNATFIEIYKD